MSAESVHLVQLPSFSELLSTLPSAQATSTPLPPGEIFHRPTSSSSNSNKVYLFPVRRLLEETATRLVVDGNDVGGCELGWMGEAELDGGRKTKRRRMSRSRSREDQNIVSSRPSSYSPPAHSHPFQTYPFTHPHYPPINQPPSRPPPPMRHGQLPNSSSSSSRPGLSRSTTAEKGGGGGTRPPLISSSPPMLCISKLVGSKKRSSGVGVGGR
ncbi:hypothetical protein BDY24DRAFT_403138 [Mrakia frigida]|uniref:uncharacterized protein n=1 Tax=Mrakia frigida TaxID=29902 RepID=UPI003FCC023E